MPSIRRRGPRSPKWLLPSGLALAALLSVVACGQSVTVTTGATTTDAVVDKPTVDEEVLTPLVADVLAPPRPVLGADGRFHLVYELLVTNPTSSKVTLTRVEVLDGEDASMVLGVIEGDDLAAAVQPFAGATDPALGPAQVTRVLWDQVSSPSVELPRSLQHRLSFTADPDFGPELGAPVVTGRTLVDGDDAVLLGAPLRGDRWLAAGGCCFPPSYHRGATLPINGAIHAPERFAIDFVQLDEQGRVFEGARDQLSSYAYFGAEIVAVADGTVVRTQDGLPEQVPGSFAPGATAASAGGNYIVVDIGEGSFAFFAHLQPGSLRVGVGDRVTKGQVIGLLGNTGNSDAPHLHFHVMDGPLPLGSNGLPYRFESFTSEGTSVTDGEALLAGETLELSPVLAGDHVDQLPLDNQVVGFPD
jgi:hypothetical protein